MASPLRFHPSQTQLFRSPSIRRQVNRVNVAATSAGAGVRQEVPKTKPIVGLRELQASLAFAIKTEDFAAAARLRDAIQALDQSRKKAFQVAAVKQQLQEAAAAEDYQEAAQLRDHLLDLLAPPQFEPAPSLSSETFTNGVRIRAQSYYDAVSSSPGTRKYVFGYVIRITNEGPSTVQLRNGYWRIVDAGMNAKEVRGLKVVGEQPVLRPGQSFEYRCACPLRTPIGSMEGYYELWTLQEASTGRVLPASMFPLKAVLGRFGLQADAEVQSKE
ncbi:hypothetical protein N2152v2_002606 [Parachlorella kessleri]